MLNILLGVAAALVIGDEPVGSPEAAVGLRPDRNGRLVLPVSGVTVTVPKAHRATAEVWGRLAFRPDGTERSDDVAIVTKASFIALSVVMTSDDCLEFQSLAGVVAGVRMGKGTWSRLSQGVIAADPVTGPPLDLETTVWCRPGLRVHSAAPSGEPTLAAWLDALVTARKRPPQIALVAYDHVLVENDESPNVVAALAPTREFALKAARMLLLTRLPLGRLNADDADGIVAADHFELLVPSAWQARIAIERLGPEQASAGCQVVVLRGKSAPLPGAWRRVRADDADAALCRTEADGTSLRLRVRGDAPSETLMDVLKKLGAEIDANDR